MNVQVAVVAVALVLLAFEVRAWIRMDHREKAEQRRHDR